MTLISCKWTTRFELFQVPVQCTYRGSSSYTDSSYTNSIYTSFLRTDTKFHLHEFHKVGPLFTWFFRSKKLVLLLILVTRPRLTRVFQDPKMSVTGGPPAVLLYYIGTLVGKKVHSKHQKGLVQSTLSQAVFEFGAWGALQWKIWKDLGKKW